MHYGKKKKDNNMKDEPLFPDVWWKSPPKNKESSSSTNGGAASNLRTRHDGNGVYGNDTINYGSIHSTTKGEEEGGEITPTTTSLIDKIVPSDLLEYVVGISCNNTNANNNNKKQHHDDCEEDEFGVPSDISNHSFSSSNNSGNNSNDDDSYYDSDDDDSSSEYEEDEIEQPHRTLGLIFFDFIRFVAISANVRCINTQMMPVFLSWGKMDVLNVVLR